MEPPISLTRRIRSLLADPDNPKSASGRARRARWHQFLTFFPDIENCRVLDLGGTLGSWSLCPRDPRELTIVNLECDDQTLSLESGTPVQLIRGDVFNLEECLPPQTFDVVYSNSLLEHLGGHVRRASFAQTARSLAPRYWVQTPYRYFPIEPHYVFPCVQFFPLPLRAEIARHWPLGHMHEKDRRASLEAAQAIELVGRAELSLYFPDARIVTEWFAGLPKSLIAFRG